MSLTSRQKRRVHRAHEAARRLRERHPGHGLLIPAQIRQPEYWRDLSIEIAGTLMSAVLLFTFARFFGYIERPSGRSELLRLAGLVAVLWAVGFAITRLRRVRAAHPGIPRAYLVRPYLHAIAPQWSIPMLLIGVALGLGYF